MICTIKQIVRENLIKMVKDHHIFVIGSSRSGTTMMGRILNKSNKIYTLKELHFFSSISPNNFNQKIDKKTQTVLLSKLFCIQNEGIFNVSRHVHYLKEAKKKLQSKSLTSLEIYILFLRIVKESENVDFICEQTPNNAYFLKEIIKCFPHSKIINMVRDPRAVLYSQKNKWRRKFLGANKIPYSESLRSYFNYHPILTSQLWNTSISHTLSNLDSSMIKIVKFEDVLFSPEKQIKEICKFLGIKFVKEMLSVKKIGSSSIEDNNIDKYIDKSKLDMWKNGGLNSGEIYISQWINSNFMNHFSYKKEKFRFKPILFYFYILIFPIKLFFAFIFNLKCNTNFFRSLKRKILKK